MTLDTLRQAGTPLLGACAATLLLASAALAHDLVVGAKLEGEKVRVEVGYDDGTIAFGARVIVSGSDGAELVDTTTDATGTARVALEEVRDGALIEAFDEEGHAGYLILTPADVEALNPP